MSPDTTFIDATASTLISVDEFQRMIDSGEIAEDAPVELLEGRIVKKMTKHPPHIKAMKNLTRLFGRILPDTWHPQFQDSVRFEDSMPEPDAAILRGHGDDYDHLAEADDIGLVIEVADTSLNKDRQKAAMYARAGISQYWILNLQGDCVEVYQQLTEGEAETSYKRIETYQRGQSVSLLLDDEPIMEVLVDDMLP